MSACVVASRRPRQRCRRVGGSVASCRKLLQSSWAAAMVNAGKRCNA